MPSQVSRARLSGWDSVCCPAWHRVRAMPPAASAQARAVLFPASQTDFETTWMFGDIIGVMLERGGNESSRCCLIFGCRGAMAESQSRVIFRQDSG